MSKAKSADKTAADTADVFKTGLEKALKNFDTVSEYGKQNAQACLASATSAGKSAEALGTEFYGYARKTLEDSVAVTRAVLGAKSLNEAFELQAAYAKAAFENYLGEAGRFSERAAAAAQDSFAPLQGRARAWLDVLETTRA